MKSKILLLFYIGAGFFFFLFWLMVVFPYSALESRVLTEIQNQTGGRYQIDMKDMDISLFGSVTFEDLRVAEKQGAKKQLLLKTPHLKVGFSPLGVLSQERDFTFYLEGQKDGEVTGAYRQEGGETEFNVEFEDYPLAELRFLASRYQVGLKGQVNGEVQLNLNKENANENQGKIDLQLEKVQLAPLRIALDRSDPSSAMTLPAIKLAGAKGSHIKGQLQKTKFDVQSIKLTGGDLDLDLKGKVTLQGRSLQNYRMDLSGNMKISESLAKGLPFLFLIEKQKNAQGVYPLTISGRLFKPNVRIGRFRVPL